MNDLVHPPGSVGCPEPEHKSVWREAFRACLWIVPPIAVVVGVLLIVIQHAQFSHAWIKFLYSLIYSAVIGIPSAVTLNWLGFRYTGRFPRLIVLINVIALLVTATVGTLAGGVVFQLLGLLKPWEYWLEFKSSYPTSVVITLVIGLSISSFETLRHKLQFATLALRTQQVEQERANTLLAEAKLSSLASRIHPHFLFNTLNSIASLIPTDPKRAEDTVSKLASLLRFSLNENQGRLVPFEQELRIVRDYLEIERTRFGQRLRYRIDAPPGVDHIRVPPLAVQSLVENSIKHVVAQRPDGGTIEVVGASEANRFRLQVIDDGPGFSLESITPEHGLGNLVSRLELLYGDRAQLSVTRNDSKTIVTLLFPVE
jgi:sensor histidine kinase YesM